MGTTYTGQRVQDTYQSIIKIGDSSNLTGTAKLLSDGFGNDTALYLSTTSLGIGVTPTFQFQTSGSAKIGSNLTVGGNLTVNGTTTIVDSTVVAIGDNMMELAKDNVANTMDIGWYGTINSSGEKYVGMFYDASSGVATPTFAIGLGTSEPSSTATWTTKGKLIIGALDATTGVFSGDVTISKSDPTLIIEDTSTNDNQARLWLRETANFGWQMNYNSNSNDFFTLNIIDGGTSSQALAINRNKNATFGANINLPNNKHILIGTDSGDPFNTSSAIRIQDSSHVYIQMKAGTNSQAGVLIGDVDDDYVGGFIYHNGTGALTFKQNNVDALSISGSQDATFFGDVTIEKTSATTNDSVNVLDLKSFSSGTTANGFGVGVGFFTENSTYSTVNELGRIEVVETDQVSLNDKMIFYVKHNNVLAERLNITGQSATFAGDVSINTTSAPVGNLQVVGDAGSAGRIYISDVDEGVSTGKSALAMKSAAHAYYYNRDDGNLYLGTNDDPNKLIITDTQATFANIVEALSLRMNSSYADSNQYMILSKMQNRDGGIILRSKPSGGTGQNDWQIVNHSSTGDLRFYAYGLADFSLTLDRENGNATFGGNIDSNGTDYNNFLGNIKIENAGPIIRLHSTNNNSGGRINITGLDADSDDLLRIQDTNTTRINFKRDGDVANSWIPHADSTYDLGSTTQRWANVWVDNINGGTPVNGAGSAGRVAFWTDADTLSNDSSFVWDSTNDRLGINVSSPSHALHLVTGNGNTNNTIRVTHSRNAPDVGTNAIHVDANYSGTKSAATDTVSTGIFVDVDSSADGTASDEVRTYGVYADVRFTGFNDVARAGYFLVESNNTTEKTSEMVGVYGIATHDSSTTDGGVSNMYGARGVAAIQDFGDVDNAYGVHGLVQIANNRNANVDVVHGLYGEIQIDEADVLNYGNMYGCRVVIDNNEGSVPVTSNQYLFYGDYQGTQDVDSFGIYCEGNQHYLANKLGINVASPSTKLHLSSTSFNDHITLTRSSDELGITVSGGQILVEGGLSPFGNDAEDLGRSDKYWRDIYVGEVKLKTDDEYYLKVYKDTRSINDTSYTTVATVNGNALASGVKINITGTSSSNVVNVDAKIIVNHFKDILIQTTSTYYRKLYIKVVSDNNEDFAIELKKDSGGNTNMDANIEIVPLGDEIVTFTNTHGHTGLTHEHLAEYGESWSSIDGDVGNDFNLFLKDDGAKLKLGAGTDLELYSNGVDGYVVAPVDDLVLQAADDVFIYTQGGEDSIIARGNGAVELYHNNIKKLETTSTGVDITDDEFNLGDGAYQKVLFDTSPSSVIGTGTMEIQPTTAPGSGTANFTTYFKDRTGGGTTKHHIKVDGKITVAGQLGVGLDSPEVKTHIFANDTSTKQFMIDQDHANGDAVMSFRLTGISEYVMGIDNSDGDKFKIANSGTVGTTTRLTIDSSGRVGIGRTNPTEKLLEVEGGILVNASKTGADEDGIFFRSGFTSGSNKYNCSIMAKDHSGNFNDGISINGFDGITFCTGANTRQERMRVGSNGYVGMGIENTNNQRLTLAEADSNGSHIKMNNSRSGGGYFIMGVGDTASNSDIVSAGGLFFYNGVTRMIINSAGRVGIGTAAPLSPSKLQVEGGDVWINRDNAPTNIYFRLNRRAGQDGGILLYGNNALDWQIVNASGTRDLNFYSYGTSSVVATIQNSTGNLGLGVSNPDNRLDIDSSFTNSVHIRGTGTRDLFSYHDSGGVGWATGSGVNYDNLLYLDSANNAIRLFTNGNEAVRVNSSGRVGIKETNPESALHIKDTNAEIRVATAADGETARIALTEDADGDTHGGYMQYVGGGDTLRLGVINAGTNTDVFTITDGFRTGIGTTAPGDALEIFGATKGILINNTAETDAGILMRDSADPGQQASMKYGSGDNSLKFFNGDGTTIRFRIDNTGDAHLARYLRHQGDTNSYLGWNAGDDFRIQVGGIQMLRYDEGISGTDYTQMMDDEFRLYANGDFHADGDIVGFSTTVSSDKRLKKNIKPIGNALDMVDKLQGVHFHWKENNEKSIGYIAQDVEKILPEMVKEKNHFDKGEYKTVNYAAMVSIMGQAIKELRAEVEQLKKQIK